MNLVKRTEAAIKNVGFQLIIFSVMAVSALLLCDSLFDPSSSLARMTGGLHDAIFGGSFFSLFSPEGDASAYLARYAVSPSAWLFAFLPQNALFFALVSAIRSFFASFVAFAFLRKTRKTSPMIALSLAIVYGLIAMSDTGALIAEQMILLPLLLTVALRRLTDGTGAFSLAILLFFTLTAGAQLLFFNLLIVLLFLMLELCREEKRELAFKPLLLPAAIALVCALPFAIFSFGTLSFEGALVPCSGTLLYRLPFLLLTFFGGTSLPSYTAVFAGMLALMLLPVFFLSARVTRKEKLLYGITLGALLLLFFLLEIFGGALGYAVTFLLLLCAARLFPEGETAHLGSRHALAIGISGMLLALLLFLLQIPEYRLPLGNGSTVALSAISGIYLPILIILLTGIALSSFCDEKNEGKASRGMLLLLVALSILDGFLFAHHRVSGEFEIPAYVRKTEKERVDALIEDAKDEALLLYDSSMLELGDARNPHFDLLPSDTRALLAHFGIESFDALLEHPSLLALFSPKGVITKEVISSPLYSRTAYEGGLSLYRPVSLPTVYAVSDGIFDLSVDGLSHAAALNSLYTAMLPSAPVLAKEVSLSFNRLDKGGFGYSDSAKEDLHLYLLLNEPCHSYYEVISAKNLATWQMQGDTLYPLGSYRADNAIALELMPRTDGGTLPALSAVSVSDAALSGTLSALSARGGTNAVTEKDAFECTVTVGDGEAIMTAFPYRDGMTVTLDGKEAETESVFGFLAVKAERGTYTLRIEDGTKALGLPMLLLLPSLAVLALYGITDHTVQKKRKTH